MYFLGPLSPKNKTGPDILDWFAFIVTNTDALPHLEHVKATGSISTSCFSLTSKFRISWSEMYIDKCRKDNLIDFSGLIYEAIQVVEADEELKTKIQNTFKYIMVDETQDTNKSQFYLVNLLAAKWRNIMLIGDIDQSIYGWRGARYQNIQDFMNDYEDCKVISLSKNYRSTPQIVKAA